MKAILRKDNCLAAIEEKSVGITKQKWKEIDNNAIANFALSISRCDLIQHCGEDYNEGNLGYSLKHVRG